MDAYHRNYIFNGIHGVIWKEVFAQKIDYWHSASPCIFFGEQLNALESTQNKIIIGPGPFVIQTLLADW